MNPRVTTIVIGVLTTVMGVFALLYPETVMRHVLGFVVDPADVGRFAYVHGEMRATYGGIFTVLGFYTILGGMDPATNRGRLLMIGLLWIGACLGRVYGVVIDGSPGLWGWLSAALEAVIGGALVAVSQMTPEAPAARSSYTPPPPPPTTPTATAPAV
ncbi:MAG: DUF4345 domain-containing protein [Deltaproteobacteria bacterium]|nr:DUF4345 domain-containing protein [Deltaproteobacteria bacterium]